MFKNKKIHLVIFIIVCIIQFIVPAKIAFDSEMVFRYGKIYKFELEAIDPNDPFRGKYLIINPKENKFATSSNNDFTYNQKVYVSLKLNEKGFATIADVTSNKPQSDEVYITARINTYYFDNDMQEITLEFPFDRYYMNEKKAKKGEDVLRENLSQKESAYALVAVANGQSILKDIIVNNKSLIEIID